MRQFIATSRFVGLIFLAFCYSPALAARNQFQNWYPEFGPIFKEILQTNCTAEYNKYLTGSKNSSNIDHFTGGGWTNQLAQPVVNCILESTAQFVQVNMGSAGVLLGLTPTILGSLGNSAEETSTLSVLARRPLLALCLAAGSPAVFPLRSFVYPGPKKLLKNRSHRIRPPPMSFYVQAIVMVVEWLIAISSVVNIVTLSNKLGVQAVFSFAPQMTYLPLLWGLLGIFIHICACTALHLRTRVESCLPYGTPFQIITTEFTPFTDRPFSIEEKDESGLFVAASWLASTYSICHLIYGTLVFSSVLFVSVKDALSVIGRYMGSVICCRIVLMYELALLRDCYNTLSEREQENSLLNESGTSTIKSARLESQTWMTI